MKYKQNLHIHTTYVDGKDSPEEMVVEAIQKGFDIIGHFDLITKNNEIGKFMDTSSKKYLNYGFEAIHTLNGKIPFLR